MPSWMFWTVIMGWDTGGVALVADDLAAWLTGLLAGAGRKKPVMVVTGTDRERALRPARDGSGPGNRDGCRHGRS
jgi:hypothetical protein